MILDSINDAACLSQLTRIARELAPTTLVRTVAQRLGSRAAVVRWLQSLPQEDDDGSESVRFIQCDVPQRTRLLPDNPNCVERSLGALMLLEVLDPATPRALATIDRPLRHTGLVEKTGGQWRAVDLFPRRNAARNISWGDVGMGLLKGVQGATRYVGKPVAKFYLGDTGGSAADFLDDQMGRVTGDQQKPPQKKIVPPPAGKRAEPAPTVAPIRPAPRLVVQEHVVGAGANETKSIPHQGGGKDEEVQRPDVLAGAAALGALAAPAGAAPTKPDKAEGGAQRGRWIFRF